MPSPPYAALVNQNTGAGTPLASSVALTDVTAAPQFTIGSSVPLLNVGQRLRVIAQGVFSTSGTPTLLLGVYYGGVSAALPLVATAATATGSGAAAWPWRIEADLLCQSVGTSGTIFTRSRLYLPTSLTAWTVSPLPVTNAAATTVDTTTSKALTIGAQWGTSSASNTLTLQTFDVEALN